MPSINLLPENFTIESYKKREKLAVCILAVLFLCGGGVLSAWAMHNEQTAKDEATDLDGKISNVEQAIERSAQNSALISSKINKEDIEKLLDEHIYLSKGVGLLKELILPSAYLKSADFALDENGQYVISGELNAANYETMLNQFTVLQDSFWIETFTPSELKQEKDVGVSCLVKLQLREELLSFHEQYWDFGAATLAGAVNGDIHIENYTVVLDKVKGKGLDAETVKVSFSGLAYDSDKLDEFEKYLNAKTDILKEPVTITRTSSPNGKPGIVEFSGFMILNH